MEGPSTGGSRPVGGPYKVSDVRQADPGIEFVPNPNWYGADQADAAEDRDGKFITDPVARQIPALKNKEIQGLQRPSRPETSYDQLQSMTSQGVQYEITPARGYRLGARRRQHQEQVELADHRLCVTAIFDLRSTGKAIIDKTVKGYFPSGAKPLGEPRLRARPAQGYQDVLSQGRPDQGNGKVDAGQEVLTDAGYTLGVRYGSEDPERRGRT